MEHSHKIVFAFLLGGALALTLTNCSSGDPFEIGISGPGSSSSAPCGGEYDLQTQRCENDVVETKCGSDSWYDASTQFCHNNAPFSKCGGTDYTPGIQECCGNSVYATATQFCYNNSSVGDFCGINPQKSYDPTLYKCESNSNGIYLIGGVSDGSQTYKAVLIGNQTWMAENLNVTPTTGNSKCYLDDPANCVKYGSLYDWEAANSVCPSGWKLPEKDDWDILTAVVGGASTEGKNLKATRDWNSSGNGTDDYGFSALPGGLYYGSYFYNVGDSGNWWSASENNSSSAYYRYMSYYDEYAHWYSGGKSQGFSVRCLKD